MKSVVDSTFQEGEEGGLGEETVRGAPASVLVMGKEICAQAAAGTWCGRECPGVGVTGRNAGRL